MFGGAYFVEFHTSQTVFLYLLLLYLPLPCVLLLTVFTVGGSVVPYRVAIFYYRPYGRRLDFSRARLLSLNLKVRRG